MTAVPSKPSPRLHRASRSLSGGWNQIGEQAYFYAKTVSSIPDAVVNYRTELYRLIAQNRYALFGRKDSCEIPSGELRNRIID